MEDNTAWEPEKGGGVDATCCWTLDGMGMEKWLLVEEAIVLRKERQCSQRSCGYQSLMVGRELFLQRLSTNKEEHGVQDFGFVFLVFAFAIRSYAAQASLTLTTWLKVPPPLHAGIIEAFGIEHQPQSLCAK